jgi:mono/diheme cytochrome c family protein
MTPHVLRWLVALAVVAAPGRAVAGPVHFGRDVLPILSDNCFGCHGPDARARKGGLRLDTRDGALRQTDPVIIPGASTASELIRRVASGDARERMPPPKSGRRLSAQQVDLLRRWVDEGAHWGVHWAFELPLRPEPPPVRDARWPRNPIDRFVLARLEAEGLAPSAEAPPEALIRRLSLDLTGLPPSPAEVDAFVADTSADAYARLVDRLLASPHYGERMSWDWLDAARYADSNGYQGDSERTMWPWRDWAVAALNRNMPFDQFTLWQLAGDLLPGAGAQQRLATAFCRNHMINGEGGRIPEENRVDYVMDMTETVGTVWLGLTLTCCRCHDHKYDPLSMRDYYGLFAFFNQTPVTGAGGDPQSPPVLEVATKEHADRLAALNVALGAAARAVEQAERSRFPRGAGLPASSSAKAVGLGAEITAALKLPADRRSRDQLEQLQRHFQKRDPAYAAVLQGQLRALGTRDALARSIPRVMVMEDMARTRETFLLTRGSYDKPGEKVSAAVPRALPDLPAGTPRNRLGLARWVVSSQNPLTARVVVNRSWQQFFGTGLVKTAEDFGVRAEKPSHPELLDYLANEFVRTGWDVKALHRLIVTSATYRQSSRVTPLLLERDPHNRLLARGARFRLASWLIRDQALAAGGLLVRRIGGPPVHPYQPPGVWEEATFGQKRYQPDRGEALYRRSLYTFWRRIIGPTVFFDSAARQTCVVKPTRTNSPLHALTTLNDVTYVEAARALAQRVLTTAARDPSARVELAFRVVLARRPTPQESQILLTALARAGHRFAADRAAAEKCLAVGESPRDQRLDPVEHAAWAVVCSTLLNLDEALTRE